MANKCKKNKGLARLNYRHFVVSLASIGVIAAVSGGIYTAMETGDGGSYMERPTIETAIDVNGGKHSFIDRFLTTDQIINALKGTAPANSDITVLKAVMDTGLTAEPMYGAPSMEPMPRPHIEDWTMGILNTFLTFYGTDLPLSDTTKTYIKDKNQEPFLNYAALAMEIPSPDGSVLIQQFQRAAQVRGLFFGYGKISMDFALTSDNWNDVSYPAVGYCLDFEHQDASIQTAMVGTTWGNCLKLTSDGIILTKENYPPVIISPTPLLLDTESTLTLEFTPDGEMIVKYGPIGNVVEVGRIPMSFNDPYYLSIAHSVNGFTMGSETNSTLYVRSFSVDMPSWTPSQENTSPPYRTLPDYTNYDGGTYVNDNTFFRLDNVAVNGGKAIVLAPSIYEEELETALPAYLESEKITDNNGQLYDYAVALLRVSAWDDDKQSIIYDMPVTAYVPVNQKLRGSPGDQALATYSTADSWCTVNEAAKRFVDCSVQYVTPVVLQAPDVITKPYTYIPAKGLYGVEEIGFTTADEYGSWLTGIKPEISENGDHYILVKAFDKTTYQTSYSLMYHIEKTGCKDLDQDGVCDDMEPKACLNTPLGEKVDKYGCSQTQVDADLDGVCNVVLATGTPWCLDGPDQCPKTPGYLKFQGCPVADMNTVMLHIIDKYPTKDLCSLISNGTLSGGSCKVPLGDNKEKPGTPPKNAVGDEIMPLGTAQIKVYDRNLLDGFILSDGQVLTKNPKADLYPTIYEDKLANQAVVGACATGRDGICYAGEETTGDYLVLVKANLYYTDLSTKDIYLGLPKSPDDFIDGLATKDFQVVVTRTKDGDYKVTAGQKYTVTGSYLEIIAPQYSLWEGTTEVFPFLFYSDSNWTVDVCMEVPEGYQILEPSDCSQVLVSGTPTDILFTLQETASPKPDTKVKIKLKHKDKDGKEKTKDLELDIPGRHKDKNKKYD